MTRKTVLLLGFEPFAGETLNSSQEIVRALDGRVIGGALVRGAILPCVFKKSLQVLALRLREHKPALVVGLGQAGGRAALTPERIAINVDDARIADNRGARPVDSPVVRGGPAAYFSTLPVKAIVAELRKKRLPAEVSQTAGTFVCNHVFYGLMHALRNQHRVKGGFIHVPFLPEQAGEKHPSLTLRQMISGIARAIEVSLETPKDLSLAGGKTH